jgi:hypothetical protein
VFIISGCFGIVVVGKEVLVMVTLWYGYNIAQEQSVQGNYNKEKELSYGRDKQTSA